MRAARQSKKQGRYPLDQGETGALLIGWIVEGYETAQLIEKLAEIGVRKVSPQAIRGFRARHRAEIAALQRQVVERVEDVTVRAKEERIRRLAAMLERVEEIVATRGLMARDVKWIGGFEDGREVQVERFDAALVAQFRALLRDVAEELGEIPKPGINIFNDNRQVNATVVNVGDFTPAERAALYRLAAEHEHRRSA